MVEIRFGSIETHSADVDHGDLGNGPAEVAEDVRRLEIAVLTVLVGFVELWKC